MILALVALIGVESRVAQATKEQQLAKAHAKVAMWIALGELKEHLGPDERVTARGDFLDEDSDNPLIEGGQRYWTGVWPSDDPTADPVWLVSGDSPDPTEGSFSDHASVPLVGGTGDSSVDDRVLAPEVPVYSIGSLAPPSGSAPGWKPKPNRRTGTYAYWIGDEGVKAKINLRQGTDARVATNFGASAIEDFDRFDSNVDGEFRDRLLSSGQLLALDFTSGNAKEALARNFHDVTMHSKGVLASTKGGGLRRDLTAGLQYDAIDSEGNAVLSGEPIFEAMGGNSGDDDGGDGSQGMGFIPGMGFPELQGFMMYNNARQSGGTWSPTRGMPRSLFPFNSRCEMRDVYPPYSYSLHIEDLDSGTPDRGNGTFGDLRLDLMRMSDGSIMINLNYNKGCGYNHTIVDASGVPLPGLLNCSYGRWRSGQFYSSTIGGGAPDLNNDPGAPLWDQLRSFYNLRSSGSSIAVQHQGEDQVGVYPVITSAQFFYTPSVHDQSNRKEVFAHVMPAIVIWNPYDVDLEPNEYTVAIWDKSGHLDDEFKIYYNSRNVCEKNYYLWHPQIAWTNKPKNAPSHVNKILDYWKRGHRGRANVDIKGPNPEPGFPRSQWPGVNTDGHIGLDLISCRPGRVWTFLDTKPGETYEVRFPFGINRGARIRRGIAAWDGVDMATFEGNRNLFTSRGIPQDYVTFTAVASSNRTRLEFRSENHPGCAGATVGICTVKPLSGSVSASKTVKAGFRSEQSNKTGFVLRNVSGLKAGQAMVFTPNANHLFKQYRIGQGANNFLEEGWHGGYSFYRRTETYFDLDEPPTHAETWIEEGSDVHMAMFEGNVDTDSSFEDPLVLVSQASFERRSDPETYPIQRFSKTARFDPDDLHGVEGRKYAMRFSEETIGNVPGAPSGSHRIRWLANYNPRASLLTPSPYEHEDETGSTTPSGLATVPNYQTYVARVQDDEWNVSVSGSDDRAFVGYSHEGGPVKGVLFEIPKDEHHFRSIGQLMHANLSSPSHNLYKEYLAFEPAHVSDRYGMRGLGYQPSYPIGNSLADPRITLGKSYHNLSSNNLLADASECDAGMHYDYSYLINDALWDAYFFSTVPRDLDQDTLEDPGFALPNPRLKMHYNQGMAPDAENLLGYDSAAANLLLDGAFNVNSTSEKAWAALLASFFGTEVPTTSGSSSSSGESPFLRMDYPHEGAAGAAANSASDETYAGYRQLESDEITRLAQEIVRQIRLRAQLSDYPRPFSSLAEFVNRNVPEDGDQSISGDNLVISLKGALQAAIDDAGLNDRFLDETVVEDAHQNLDLDLLGEDKPGGSLSAAGATASHAPGYLTQADLLARLGPCLAVRSDTFRIRAYGEALHPVRGDVRAKAWCEAIFQRVPEADVDEGEGIGDTSEWNGLHRDFRLVHFRWIPAEDI
ncbi:MAG: hypothetical protein CMI31_05065 [Opitutae bacterium]|nr:hypothetical protein [Opitutae bacterium]